MVSGKFFCAELVVVDRRHVSKVARDTDVFELICSGWASYTIARSLGVDVELKQLALIHFVRGCVHQHGSVVALVLERTGTCCYAS